MPRSVRESLLVRKLVELPQEPLVLDLVASYIILGLPELVGHVVIELLVLKLIILPLSE